MVSYADVVNNNESLKVAGSGAIAVFVGATNGIGLGALTAFTKHTSSPTIYIVGRSIPKVDEIIETTLKPLNNSATFHAIEAEDLTLVASAARAANEIAQNAKRVDLLIMSPGYISISRSETPEGLDRVTAIRFYSRMRFLVTLAPLLRNSPSPRVVSVLAGGMEGQLWADDFRLKDHYSLIKAAGAAASMMTLFLEEFTKQPGNEKFVVCHLYPGGVGNTGLKISDVPWPFQILIDWVVAPIFRVFGSTPEESGERVIFAATSGRFRRIEEENSENAAASGSLVQKGSTGKVGSGVYLVQPDSSVKQESTTAKKMKDEQDMGKKVYKHTMEEFERIGG